MKVKFCLPIFFLFFVYFGQTTFAQQSYQQAPIERLNFKLSYGWFTVGKAEMTVREYLSRCMQEGCYKVQFNGWTAGLLGVFSRVDDEWGAILGKKSFVPIYSYRNLEEGNYRLDEKVYFDYDSMDIRVEHYDRDKKLISTNKYMMEVNPIFDMISSFMYVRYLDYEKINEGDTLFIDAFFDKETYNYQIVYFGKHEIRSKIGKFLCHKLIPILPENEIFKGTTPVTIWISTDERRIPVLIKASMFLGTTYCEIIKD